MTYIDLPNSSSDVFKINLRIFSNVGGNYLTETASSAFTTQPPGNSTTDRADAEGLAVALRRARPAIVRTEQPRSLLAS